MPRPPAILERLWYGPRGPREWALAWALAPLEGLFRAGSALRREAYRRGWRRQVRLPVPVVVVGNLSVGGTGKTPLVAALAGELAAVGRRPGILTRGYGGRAQRWPQAVGPGTDPALVGDEPVLLARRTGLPVAAGPDRAAAARLLLEAGCDLVLADDGLQHLRLARDLEIVVVDGARLLGNGRCLPAGPLREPPARLAGADLVAVLGGLPPGGGGLPAGSSFPFSLVGQEAMAVAGEGQARPLAAFRGAPVHAVAGIGHPGRFFAHLHAAGLEVLEHPFPDHHRFRSGELDFGDGLPVLMTEKDAVKCARLPEARRRPWWFVPVTARLPRPLVEAVCRRLGLPPEPPAPGESG